MSFIKYNVVDHLSIIDQWNIPKMFYATKIIWSIVYIEGFRLYVPKR